MWALTEASCEYWVLWSKWDRISDFVQSRGTRKFIFYLKFSGGVINVVRGTICLVLGVRHCCLTPDTW